MQLKPPFLDDWQQYFKKSFYDNHCEKLIQNYHIDIISLIVTTAFFIF